MAGIVNHMAAIASFKVGAAHRLIGVLSGAVGTYSHRIFYGAGH